MVDCPKCGMRDDDWFLCRNKDCATKIAVQDHARITELEAENARLTKERDDLQNRHDSLEHALDGIKSRSESLSRTGAVKERGMDFVDALSRGKIYLDKDMKPTYAIEPAAPDGRQEAVGRFSKLSSDALAVIRENADKRLACLSTAELVSAQQTRPTEQMERKFRLGDRVTKIKGSSWTGRVVGFYSTSLTPIGYCVESETETGSVQIYPEAALRSAGISE